MKINKNVYESNGRLQGVTIIVKDGEHAQRIIPKLLSYPNYLYNLLNIYSVPMPVKIRRAHLCQRFKGLYFTSPCI